MATTYIAECGGCGDRKLIECSEDGSKPTVFCTHLTAEGEFEETFQVMDVFPTREREIRKSDP